MLTCTTGGVTQGGLGGKDNQRQESSEKAAKVLRILLSAASIRRLCHVHAPLSPACINDLRDAYK